MSSSPWFARAFGSLYSQVYGHRSDATADREVDFIVREISAPSHPSLLDLACGAGRHQRAFARRSFCTVGLDLSRELLGEHRREGALPIVRGDMRELPFAPSSFDLVTHLFTSFGYFPTEAEDHRVLKGIAKVLRIGGTYVLDFLNVDYVKRNLQPETERQVDTLRVRERRRIEGNRVLKEVTIERLDGKTLDRYTERVRLYRPEDLKRMLADHGLHCRVQYGDFAGRSLAEGDRCISFAELCP